MATMHLAKVNGKWTDQAGASFDLLLIISKPPARRPHSEGKAVIVEVKQVK